MRLIKELIPKRFYSSDNKLSKLVATVMFFLVVLVLSGCSSSNKVLNESPPASSMTSHNLKMQGVQAQVGNSVSATTLPVGSPILPTQINVNGEAIVLGSNGVVSIVNTSTNKVVNQIATNSAPPQNPDTLAVIPSQNVGLVVSESPSSVGNAIVVFNYVTGQVVFTIAMPFAPVAITTATNGSIALVSGSQGQLASLDLTSRSITNVISLNQSSQAYMDAVAITPNQKYAVVVDDGGEVAGNIVYVVNLPSLQVLNSVSVGIGSGYFLNSMAISPDSSVAYVVNGGFGDGQLIPVSIPTATVGGVIDVGGGPLAVTLSSNGNTAYVVDGAVGYGNLVVPVDLSQGFSYPNRTGGTPYQVGGDVNAYMDAIQLTQNQKVAYVTDRENGFLYPIDLAAGLASKPIYVGNSPVAVELI